MEAALKAIWRAILWARVAHDALNVVADAPVAYGCDQVGLRNRNRNRNRNRKWGLKWGKPANGHCVTHRTGHRLYV